MRANDHKPLRSTLEFYGGHGLYHHYWESDRSRGRLWLVICQRYSPLKRGVRFSLKAVRPSSLSLVGITLETTKDVFKKGRCAILYLVIQPTLVVVYCPDCVGFLICCIIEASAKGSLPSKVTTHCACKLYTACYIQYQSTVWTHFNGKMCPNF